MLRKCEKYLYLPIEKIMALLKRKVDGILNDWKARPDHKPLIVKGARQVI